MPRLDEVEQLSKLAAGMLPSIEARALEAELAVRADLAEALERLATLDALCTDVARELAIPQRDAVAERLFRGRHARWGRWAAAGLAAACAAGGLALLKAKPLQEEMVAPQPLAARPPSAPSFDGIELPEGEIRLLPDSRVRPGPTWSLEQGTAVVRGAGVELMANGVHIAVDGAAIVTTEPFDESLRALEAQHFLQGDEIMQAKRLKPAALASTAAALFVLNGIAEVAAADVGKARVVAGQAWVPSPVREASPPAVVLAEADTSEKADVCSANVDRPGLQVALERAMPLIDACLSRCADDSCAGRFNVRASLTVGPGGVGRLLEPSIEDGNSIKNPFVMSCVTQVLLASSFPATTDGKPASLSLPFAVREPEPGAGYRAQSLFSHGKETPEESATARVSVATEGSPSLGDAAAPVTVVEFMDFECPYCRRAQATVEKIAQAYPGRVRFVFKQQPMPFHPHAALAALAALAADRQGKYWDYAKVLYANPLALDRRSLIRSAKESGLDGAVFERDLDDPKLLAAVAGDQAEAARAGARGIPTFFVNGRVIRGAQPFETFKELIDGELGAARR